MLRKQGKKERILTGEWDEGEEVKSNVSICKVKEKKSEVRSEVPHIWYRVLLLLLLFFLLLLQLLQLYISKDRHYTKLIYTTLHYTSQHPISVSPSPSHLSQSRMLRGQQDQM